MVFNVREDMQKVIPAITHVDGTVRIQTVTNEENQPLFMLLENFKKKSGHGIILNTSFNIKGEPIVCTPSDAVSSYLRADVDALVMGNFITRRV